MEELLISQVGKVKDSILVIEKRLPVKVIIKNKRAIISGEKLAEFVAYEIIRAVDFGFDIEDALLLLNDKFTLQFVNIKDYTRKKNFAEVRARIIGTNGRAKGTVADLTGSVIVVHENQVGILVDDDHLDSALQAVISLTRGAKHANVFAYLEKQNKERKKFDEEDLGLKIK